MNKYSTSLTLPTMEERRSFLEEKLRHRTHDWIEAIMEEEMEAALGSGRSQRSTQRRGYRKGKRRRTFTTSTGRHTLMVPRAAFFEADPVSGTKEWRSALLPRYARRTPEVEEAMVASYLCGTNTRKIKRALAPLLKGAALSKSTVSRIVARLSTLFAAWEERDLRGRDIAIVYLDGFTLKLRLGGHVERVPVLCAIGVGLDGRKELLVLKLRTSESTAAWKAVTEDLSRRGVTAPVLAVIDGNDGLHAAVTESWPGIDVQRCTRHKLVNLLAHAPKRRAEQITADYHAIIYADSEAEARRAWGRFERRWQRDCPGVVKSLREGGDELLTFFRYPKAMWKCLRTTNAIERLNGEFRRRVKTQGSLPSSAAGLHLLFGLVAYGVVTLRHIDGWRHLKACVTAKRAVRTQPHEDAA